MQKNAVAQRSAPGDGKKVYFAGPLFNAAERENMTQEEKLKKIFDKGAIYRGRKPVHWCKNCHTALAEAEAMVDTFLSA